MKTNPIPTATELRLIDSNIATQCIANKGPRIKPCFIKRLKLSILLSINNNRTVAPIKVLTPTNPSELMSVVFIINGIVPQSNEIKNIDT